MGILTTVKAVGGAVKTVGTVFNNIFGKPIADWSARKTIKSNALIKIAQTRADAEVQTAIMQLEMVKAGQIIEADYDQRAQDNMKYTWKDEVLLIIHFAPVVMCFVPDLQEYASKGFEILDDFPMWFKVIVIGIDASVFGLRWVVAPIINRWSNKKTD